MKTKRRFPIGAEYSKKGTHFRVWAPGHSKVKLILEDLNIQIPLIKEPNDYFSLFVPNLKKGSLYLFELGPPAKKQKFPDPASRYQPFGVSGPSAVIDRVYPWTDEDWQGLKIDDVILYELHIGTFTPEGTFTAAAQHLEQLADLGITAIEIMPLNEFPGKFGWGYDGINLFAPYHIYGMPEELKAFINKAHRLKIGIILDVVYNHFGPEGSFLSHFSKDYFNPNYTTEWGDAINFDHPSSREFFLTNACYWIEEFHFDGLRVDATPWFFCDKSPHVLGDLSHAVKKTSPEKNKVIIGESEKQEAILLMPYKQKGYQFDALWNDDFHHTALVRLKGKREAYYTDYLGSPQEFISSLKHGFLYQGQYYDWQKQKRGVFNLDLPPSSKIIFLENHDQVANTATGKRLHLLADPGNYRALTCLVLLGPNIPMLFQGQEFGSTAPFYYFADHEENLNIQIFKGRKKFLSQFPSLASKKNLKNIPSSGAWHTFAQCKLDHSEKEKNLNLFRLHKELIRLRKEDPIFKKVTFLKFDGAVLNEDAFLIRFFGDRANDRLIIINFGVDFIFNPAPEPLMAINRELEWEILFSSDSLEYGGEGIIKKQKPYWKISGHSAIVYKTYKVREK